MLEMVLDFVRLIVVRDQHHTVSKLRPIVEAVE